MVRSEQVFVSGLSCAASLWGPRARADHARRPAGTLQCIHTYIYSPVDARARVSPDGRRAAFMRGQNYATIRYRYMYCGTSRSTILEYLIRIPVVLYD